MLKQYMLTSVKFIFFLIITFSLSLAYAQQTQTFNFTGGTQTWTVPACVYNVEIVAAGGQGGGADGGNGAIVTTTISVCPGDQIEMTVGGQGGSGDNSGGFNGGGSGFTSSDGDPGNNSFGGGGATNVSLNGTLLMVAAGGGGTGGGSNTADGGDGGCNGGADGDDTFGDGGGGGTQTAGGAGGAAWTGNTLGQPGQDGAMNQGGDGGFWDTASGGGGGGGYYGGGGGGSDGCCTGGNGGGGGGGGSSLVPAGGNCNQGGHVGDGNVVINYTPYNNPPTGNAPANLTVECTADIPAPDPTTVTGLTADPCGNFPTVTHQGDVSDNNTCPEVITRTYRVEDDCGNFIEVDQLITVDDTQAPTITGTLNLITDQGCTAADATAPVTTVANLEAMGTTIDDNCTTDPNLTVTSSETVTGTCPIVITRTYTIEDECGNTSTVDQTLEVDDTQAPTITGTLNLITDQGCTAADATAPVTTVANLEAMGVTIDDNCTTDANLTVTNTQTTAGTCPIVITRTYTIEDECGNTSTVDQTLEVEDTQAPTITGTLNLITDQGCTAADATAPVTTVANLEAMGVTIGDNCTTDANLTVTNTETTAGTCPLVITRTYTVEDECGNTSTVDQTLEVDDTQAPTITGTLNLITDQGCTAADATAPVTTVANLEAMGTTIDDNCTTDPNLTVTSSETVTGTCPIVITRTYTIEDECGNTSTVDQTLEVDDTQAPTITGTLNLITDQGCTVADATAPVTTVANLEAMGVTIDDNCTTDANLTVTNTQTTAGTCPIVITRTYTIEDDCGNTSTVDQTLEVEDTQAPTITGTLNLITDQGCTAADATAPVTTVANLEAMGVTIGDNCTTDANLTVTNTETTAGTCPLVITRTYTVEDECGNTSTVDQTLELEDTQAPTITGTLNLITDQGCTAADATAPVTTVANLEAMGVTIDDNCTTDANLIVTNTQTTAGTCPIVITRTYTIEDECGNTSTVDQTLEVEDTQAPTASNPATTTVQCASDVPATDPTVVTDEADNCTANPTVTFISETTDNNVCDGEELTRVYEIEDDCNNTTTVIHTIIIDAYTPTFTLAGTDPTVCGGADGSITISGLDPNTDYDVSYGGGPTVTITTDGAGEYVVNGLSAGSYSNFEIAYTACPQCFQSSSTVIDLEDPNSPPVDGGPDQEVCEGEQVTLTATNPNNVAISWDNGITDGTAFTPGVGTTIYTVTADDAGCISTDQVEVTVNPLPNVDAGNDITICEGETVTLSGSGANSYNWDNGVVDGVSFTPGATTNYTLTGTSAEGCVGSDQVEVIVNPKPTVNFEADTTRGCVPLTVNITNTTAGTIDNCKYTFSDGTTYTDCNVTHTFNNVGCYDISLEVENGSGCINSSTINDMICLDNFPTAEFTYSPDELTNLNFEIEFNNSSSDASTFNWMFGDGGSSNAENPVHTYPSTEEEDFYTVQLIAFSDLGCTDTTYADIPYREQLLYFVPNTFTPDDDKFNETFKPIFTSGFDPQDYKLLIFNRWGETIFESNNADVGWDGTYGTDEKEIVKDGTYVWKIEFKTKYDDERKVEVGHVNVLK